RLLPAMIRMFTGTVRVPPRRSMVRFCSTRSSFTCIDNGTSSMSSRNSVPPSASSKRPGRSLIAPVKAPRSCPKSSDSISVSEKSAQLTATKGRCLRRLDWWMSVAVTSLPVPLSPVTSTVLSLFPMTRRNSNTARIRALCPTTSDSLTFGTWDVMPRTSRHAQGAEFRNLFPQGSFDPHVQRHVSARTTGAHSGEPDRRRVAFHCYQLDVAAVRLQKGAYSSKHCLNAFLRNHGCSLIGRRFQRGRRTMGQAAYQ